MSKLGMSLRDSISAEKKSIEEKFEPKDQNTIKAIKSPVTKKAVSVKHVLAAQKVSTPKIKVTKPVITEEYTVLDALKEKLSSKNLPAGLYYEILLVLLKANLLNKQSENVSDASAHLTKVAQEYLSIPLRSLESIVDLNAFTTRKMMDEISKNIHDLSAMKRPVGLMACFSQIAIDTAENSKGYVQGLSAVAAESQKQVRRLVQDQCNSVQQTMFKMLSGFGAFNQFQSNFLALAKKS